MLTASALYSQKRELHKWYDSLLILMREVEYMYKEDEGKINDEYQRLINAIDQDYEYYRGKNRLERFKKFGYLYELLRYYERFIRVTLKDRDLLLISKGDPTRAIRN